MSAERVSVFMLVVMTGIIVLLILGSLWWVHRIDSSPKPPLHSRIKPGASAPCLLLTRQRGNAHFALARITNTLPRALA